MEELEFDTPKKDNRKNKRRMLTLLILLALVFVGGTSFALWQITLQQTDTNIITTGCLNLTLTNDTDAITVTDATPTIDDEGRKLIPYTFTVENTCTVNTRYVINLETVSDGDKKLADKYVKANLLKGEDEVFIDKLVESNVNEEKVIDTASAAYKLYEGMLPGKTTQTYSLRIWMAEDTEAVEEVMEATWKGKITITASYIPVTTSRIIKNIPQNYTGEIWADTYKPNITKVVFENTVTTLDDSTPSFDISASANETAKVYAIANADDTAKFTAHFQGEGGVIANPDSSYMFAGFSALTTIEGIETIDFSRVSKVDHMFDGCSNLTATITIDFIPTSYEGIFANAATAEGATITLNYTDETLTIVNDIISKKTEGSNIVIGRNISAIGE